MALDEVLYATAALVALTNPVAEIPIFMGIVSQRSAAARRAAALKVALGVLTVLGVAALGGRAFLEALDIGMPAFRAAGGLLLVVMGLEMVKGQEVSLQTPEPTQSDSDDRLWVPLVMPMLAGPGAIVTAITLTLREETHRPVPLATLLAVVTSAVVVLVVLLAAGVVANRTGPRSLRIFTAFSGLILVAIGVQMGFTGTAEFFGISAG